MILLAAGSVMALISWQKWPDLLIDFGQQVYIPWRLSEGEVLYRDIFYLYGPASAYFHALVFKLAGPGILVLAAINMLILAWMTGLVYRIFVRAGDRLTATVAGGILITVFGFAQYLRIGNYNFVTPYYYELTHGIFLTLLAIHQLMKYLEDGRRQRVWWIGFLTGAIFLTKTEVFLAAFAAVAIGLWTAWRRESPRRQKPASRIFEFALSMTLPPALFFVYFSLHMPVTEAFTAMISPWIHTANSTARALPFFQGVMGTDAPATNLGLMALYGCLIPLGLWGIYFLHRLTQKFSETSPWPVFAFAILTAGTAIWLVREIPWFDLIRPLPLFLLVYGIYLFRRIASNSPALQRDLTLLTLTVFSFVLLFKMILNTHVFHYGFALAMPGTLVLVLILLHELPGWVQRVSGSRAFYRSASLVLILVFLSVHVWVSSSYYAQKVFPVGSGRDTILDYDPRRAPRGLIVQVTLDLIQEKIGPNEPFAAFPVGTMLNYLSRHRNPIRYTSHNPLYTELVGDDRILDALKNQAPPYVLLVERDFSEFGRRYFGQDYGQSIYSWIRKHYVTVQLIGKKPFTGQGFGIEILKRSD